MAKYAYVVEGVVKYIEVRNPFSGKLVHPDYVNRFVEIPEGVTVTEGMLYSDGEFKENPVAPGSRIAALEAQQEATNQAVLGLMDMMMTN